MRIVRAMVIGQNPHPMLGASPFVIVKFDDPDYVKMDRRRIKREQNRALKKWRATRRKG